MRRLIPDQLRTNNFDAIRLLMALLVVWSHSFALYLGSEETEPVSVATRGHYNSGNVAVLVFFTISGFLVTQSFANSKSIRQYFSKRISRIYPGYLVATSICAFALIPALSRQWPTEIVKTLSLNLLLQNYFPDETIFSGNHVAAVNGSLWSIPFEFWCYIGLAGLGVCGALRRRWVVPVLTIALMVIRIWLDATGRKPGGGFIGEIIGWPYTWFSVAPCFLLGAAVYLYREVIPRSGAGAIVLLVTFLLACRFDSKIAADFIFPIAVTYAVFYAAFVPSPFERIGKHGDFSYGTYLYAYPIQQTILTTGKPISLLAFFGASAMFSLAAGVLSWFLVERWFLKRKRGEKPAKPADLHWHAYDVPLWGIRPNGSQFRRFDTVMRRRLPDGSWEYRSMTPEELRERQDILAW